jgi:distribution and morphology protein 10
MGAEWWIRPRQNASNPSAPTDMIGEPRTVQGVLKASVSTNQVSVCPLYFHSVDLGALKTASLLWEGRLRKVLVGLGVVSNLANRSEPIKAMGLELAYFASEGDT